MFRWCGRPSQPVSMSSFAYLFVGMNRYVNGTMVVRPRRSAASAISRASRAFMPSGFSHRTWSPASMACITSG